MTRKPKDPKPPKKPKKPNKPSEPKSWSHTMNVRVAFASRNFVSGQQVRFKLYDRNEHLINTSFGNEWADTGVYYKDYNLSFGGNRVYLVIAEEVTGNWKASKLINESDKL